MSSGSTQRLAELVDQKLQCLVQLLELAVHQDDLIERGEMTALLSLLATKQRVLLALQQTEKSLDPFREEDPDRRVWATADDRQRCAERISQCERLLAEVLSREKQSETVMRQRRDEVTAQLNTVSLASQARGAYTQTSDSSARQLDLSSD